MGETKELIVDEIEQARSALDRDLDMLQARFKEDTDIKLQARRQVEQHPWLIPAAFIACGLLLGMIFASLSPEPPRVRCID